MPKAVWRAAAAAGVTIGARLVALGVLELVGEAGGAMPADVAAISAALFPGESVDAAQVKSWLAEAKAAGLIRLEVVAGQWTVTAPVERFELTPDAKPKKRKASDQYATGGVVLEFPLTGQDTPWQSREGQVERWRELYPTLDVVQCLRNALGYLEVTPGKRPTTRGVKTFLVGWLNRDALHGPRMGSYGKAAEARPTRGSMAGLFNRIGGAAIDG